MDSNEILEAIAAFSPRPPDELGTPEPETIAFVVRTGRHLRQWKKSTLADFAGVSLSSIERIERADRVSSDTLEKVGMALGHDAGAFTAPRLPLTPEQVVKGLTETYGHLEFVQVAPLRTQAQVRKLARCHGFLLHGPDVPADLRPDLTGLYEWLDLASFILSEPDSSEAARRRILYGDILRHVATLERNGFTVLAGVLHLGDRDPADWRIAVVTVTPKATDPGALKRKVVLVDRRNIPPPCRVKGSEGVGADD